MGTKVCNFFSCTLAIEGVGAAKSNSLVVHGLGPSQFARFRPKKAVEPVNRFFWKRIDMRGGAMGDVQIEEEVHSAAGGGLETWILTIVDSLHIVLPLFPHITMCMYPFNGGRGNEGHRLISITRRGFLNTTSSSTACIHIVHSSLLSAASCRSCITIDMLHLSCLHMHPFSDSARVQHMHPYSGSARVHILCINIDPKSAGVSAERLHTPSPFLTLVPVPQPTGASAKSGKGHLGPEALCLRSVNASS